MRDVVYRSFLEKQLEEGLALADASDIVKILPMREDPVQHYVAHFTAKGLVRDRDGSVTEADACAVGIWFPVDYLHRFVTPKVLTWLGPSNVFHPNIRPPVICVGHVGPGTSLVDLLFQIYEIWSYQNVVMREDDALDGDACAWARAHQDRFPVDRRPLKRRRLELRVSPVEGA